MTFEVLTAAGGNAERWKSLIEGLAAEHRDIHFLPEYGRIYHDTYGFEPHLAVYTGADGYVIQSFVRRPLAALPFLAGAADAANYYDIANPYGYGGPLCSAATPSAAQHLYKSFAGAFASWCDEQNLASEFASLHPFMASAQLALIGDVFAPRYEKDVVFIDLTGDEADILKKLRKGHRSSLTVARRAGVKIDRVEPTSGNLTVFKEMYDATMIRRQAAQRWFVPGTYFADCMRHLGSSRTSLFFATVDGAIESGCLLMHDFSTAYFHFAATWAKHLQLGANNMLVFEAGMWAKKAGYTCLHLGGGVTSNEDDSLLRFKAGFSDQRAPLYTYFSIRDQVVYDRLCERKRAYERAMAGAESASDFLPLYRR